MQNFRIVFENSPWFLLLLILAVVLTLFPYFRLSKKYRKTRNRITSIVLHTLTLTFAILVLAGINFLYELPNDKNELIFLVDVSETQETVKEERDQLVGDLIAECEGGGYRVGIVTFGFDQEYVVPLTNDLEEIYSSYLDAELPDISATNIAAALQYTKELFENPETGKIVLITDGKETDEEALTVIRSVSAQGIKVDTVYVGSEYEGADARVKGIELPDYHVSVDEECTLSVTLQSKAAGTAAVTLIDNVYADNVLAESAKITQDVELIAGEQTITFQHTFTVGDLHELQVEMQVNDDLLEQNNTCSSYIYLKVYNKILILERTVGESDALVEMLNSDAETGEEAYDIQVLHIAEEEVPVTVDGLRAYDQVILNNISKTELKSVVNEETGDTLDVLLEEYVREYGGGLFTVGGNNESGEANVYNQDEMYGSLYQQMLPVESINYTPPVGIMIIIDVSGSMTGSNESVGDRPLDWAIAGALTCLEPEVLSDRDYVGIMTLDTTYGKILAPTPLTQRDLIKEKILELQEIQGGGTVFSNAVESASQALMTLKNVAKRHIVIVTDGGIAGDDWDPTKAIVQEMKELNDISVSVIGIGISQSSSGAQNSAYDQMTELTTIGGGKLRLVSNSNPKHLISEMRDDLKMPSIEAINDEEPFAPIINELASSLVQGIERGEGTDKNRMTVTLDGYYGVRKKEAAEVILTGEYGAPLYAQWKYGNGTVGSFMCDLNGNWSSQFMQDPNGQLFIDKVVKNLMPVADVRPSDMRVEIEEDNYTNSMTVIANLQEGESVKGELIFTEDPTEVISLNEITEGAASELRERSCYVTLNLSEGNNYSRCKFVVKESGVYKIVIVKYNKDGNEIGRVEAYKSFAYSEEYNSFITAEEDGLAMLQTLAEAGNGANVQDKQNPIEIFEGFVTAIEKSFDPSLILIISAIVLFLLDIAVRKFKFKWPHEIIRDYKKKKEENKK